MVYVPYIIRNTSRRLTVHLILLTVNVVAVIQKNRDRAGMVRHKGHSGVVKEVSVELPTSLTTPNMMLL